MNYFFCLSCSTWQVLAQLNLEEFILVLLFEVWSLLMWDMYATFTNVCTEMSEERPCMIVATLSKCIDKLFGHQNSVQATTERSRFSLIQNSKTCSLAGSCSDAYKYAITDRYAIEIK